MGGQGSVPRCQGHLAWVSGTGRHEFGAAFPTWNLQAPPFASRDSPSIIMTGESQQWRRWPDGEED